MKKLLLTLTQIFLYFSVTAVEAPAQWVLTNPPGGDWIYVYDFAFSDTVVYAGADIDALVAKGGVVFRSTDNGTNWENISTSLSAPEVRALAVRNTSIFAGTWGDGVFRSTDNGANWTAVNSGLTNTNVTALAISDTNMFAGTYGSGVYVSTDNAATWTVETTGLTNKNIWSLAVSGPNIFAGTDGGGVFRSTNNGANWTAVNTGLPSGLYGVRLAINDSNIYVGAGGGVFRSTDNGENWTDVSDGLPNTWVLDVAVSDANVFALTNWGGISLSTDNGANWTLVNEGMIDSVTLAIGVSKTFAFVSGSSGSLWRRPLSELIGVVAVVEEEALLPSRFNISQNYPNPFNPVTTLRFELSHASNTSLTIYDISGREVAELAKAYMKTGQHLVQWDAQHFPSGIYIARLVTPEYTRSIKMVLLK